MSVGFVESIYRDWFMCWTRAIFSIFNTSERFFFLLKFGIWAPKAVWPCDISIDREFGSVEEKI
jgi:hypothetical protein